MNIHLCFHGIGTCAQEREPGESRYWISEDLFRHVIDEVSDRPDVLLSFDDGNRSDIDIALPILREHRLVATFFALAGRLDDPSSLGPTELTELRTNGMHIGSHGWAHIPWRGLSESEAHRELVDARVALREASGASVADAALPLGRYDRELLRRLKDAGYRTVYTSDRFPARPGSWLQARYSVMAQDTIESVRHTLRHGVDPGNAKNLIKSAIKRLR